MNLVSGSRHPYRDEGAILTNMAPSSLRDGDFIQLKGQCDPYRKVDGIDFVSSENEVAVLLFTYSLALKWLVHRALFS
jgi:hypothetical protein